MARPDPFGSDDVFATLFGTDPGEIDAAGHPPEEALRAYRARRATTGRLDPAAWLAAHNEAQTEADASPWSRQAITAHLMTCRACRARYDQLKSAPSSVSLRERLDAWRQAVRGAFAPTPRPAAVAIATQSVVIVGLAAALLAGSFGPGQPTAGSDSPETASAQSPVDSQRADPAEPSGGAESDDEERGTTAHSSLPDPTAQRIQVLSSSSDPDARVNAARELQNRSDPSLVRELTRIYQQESHPEVQEALNRTINAVMSNLATQYDSALQAVREFQGQSSLGSSELMDEARRQLNQLLGDGGMAASSGPASENSGGLVCNASERLTLAQLRRLSEELGGMTVVNPSLPSESFEIRVPFTADLAENLSQLEDEMGLRCYQE